MVRPTNAAEDVISTTEESQEWVLPPLGDNPSSTAAGTTPGSFANRGRIRGIDTFVDLNVFAGNRESFSQF